MKESSVEYDAKQAELIAAAAEASQMLARVYFEFGRKLGPFATQSHRVQMRLAAALKAVGAK